MIRIHAHVHQHLSTALAEMDDDEVLVVRAHSFGYHVFSNFVYDNHNLKGAHAPVLADGTSADAPTPLSKLPDLNDRLALFATTGCNIPLLVAGAPNSVPFTRPNDRFQWINIYDKDDVLGWPLRPLGAAFDVDWIRDCKENTGGLLRSHNNYWFDAGVNEQIAEAVADVIR